MEELLDLTTIRTHCPVIYHLSRRGLAFPPSNSAQLGIEFHEAIALALQGRDWKDYVRNHTENPALIEYLVNRTLTDFQTLFAYNEVETEVAICTEYEGQKLVGLVDAILHTPEGLVLIDWKTTQRTELQHSPLQLNTYKWILERKGYKVNGLFYVKVNYRKYKHHYTALITPLSVPELPAELVEAKLNQLINALKISIENDLPAIENCTACPLLEQCTIAWNLNFYKASEIAKFIIDQPVSRELFIDNDWQQHLESKLNEGGNRYGCKAK